ncbi:ABC transporter permease [Advenella sp. S44]|uniref:ABC transporter substrate-binding protein n=1 Tax=Advenella sp. S44 TaxID=1982755 RepID=UPI000C2AEAFB|nr:ABC transporter substrate-binding protein [Advenella sp. S44]PJX27754.1 ABC transporter permease [Advenella sp. S44]
MRLTKTLFALAMASLGTQAMAAGISDDVIRIGFITDMSGVYSDIDGKAGVEAIKMAIEDAGGAIDGKKIELLSADHQNKADVASARVRQWIDQDKVDMIIGGTNSATALASAAVAAGKKVPYIAIGPGTTALTNANCTPYTIHYAYNTKALANVTGGAVVKQGGSKWFFLTADYAFGHSLEADTTTVVKQAKGEVVGSVKVPLGTTDFSSYMLQAQSSGAQIMGLANAGGDFINSMKAGAEFGVFPAIKPAGLLVFINDVHSLGLQTTQGLYLTASWYWDQDDESRAWAKKFEDKVKRKPSFLQAGDYAAVGTYLKAVAETKTDNGDEIIKWFKSNKIDNMFMKNGVTRKDGLVVHDMYLMQVKTPEESKGPWDYYKVVEKVPGEVAYGAESESTCKL